jgi:hypothetical protein
MILFASFELFFFTFALSPTLGLIYTMLVATLFQMTENLWRRFTYDQLLAPDRLNALRILAQRLGVDELIDIPETFGPRPPPPDPIVPLFKKRKVVPAFNCRNPDCGRVTCVECAKDWEALHVCHEKEKDSLRVYVEQAISEAFIRVVGLVSHFSCRCVLIHGFGCIVS